MKGAVTVSWLCFGMLIFFFFCFSVLLQLFFLPPQLNPFAVCTLSVWMSVKLLPVYQTLVTNTVANTARLPVQKRSRMCVSSFVKSCTFFICAASVTLRRHTCILLPWDKMIKASFISCLSKSFLLPVAAKILRSATTHFGIYVGAPWGRLTCVCVCVCNGLHFGCVSGTSVQSVKLFGLNFSKWSISEGLS